MQSVLSIVKKTVDTLLYSGYEYMLTREIKEFRVPEHIAIIMDGNRRYARKFKVSTWRGHIKGANTTERVLDWCYELGVKQLTVYAFSTENLNRSDDEKQKLFELIGIKLEKLMDDERTHKRGMRVRIMGNIHLLPEALKQTAMRAENITRNYSNMYLNIAMAYGGRQEIVDTAQIIASKISSGEMAVSDINEDVISSHLYPSPGLAVPDVDLVIRTGGDERMSNFLPWQANGSECAAYFCAPYWPEFRKIDFLRSIRTYQTREHEWQKNTILRIVKLLDHNEYIDVGQVVRMSQRAGNITDLEVRVILRKLSGSREMEDVAFVW
ncbi:MAG: di-trans,poly-cis-decaprenylcistransferase [Methanosarcinales archaeon]|nr:di-trans,poly-cis-decaprenylcistransferase [Methanosarcinales archaeon]